MTRPNSTWPYQAKQSKTDRTEGRNGLGFIIQHGLLTVQNDEVKGEFDGQWTTRQKVDKRKERFFHLIIFYPRVHLNHQCQDIPISLYNTLAVSSLSKCKM